MKKIFFAISLGIISATLTWCGWSNSAEDVSEALIADFGEKFLMEIPDGYTTVNPKTVENQEITNQVLAAYKKAGEDEWFQDNIVITASKVWPDLDYEQFWNINNKKLNQSLIWYSDTNQKRIKIDCNGEEIQWLWVTFDLTNTLSDSKEKTYMAQLQYLDAGQWYILSYATADSKARDKANKWMTISCW